MTALANSSLSQRSMTILSRLVLTPRHDPAKSVAMRETEATLLAMTREEFDNLANLANLNHVILRAFEIFCDIMREAGDDVRLEWAQAAIAEERTRVATAVGFLKEICGAFEQAGYDVAVIKSLDHLPDLGSDLDLYTNADNRDVSSLMNRRFGAHLAERSWGDRLARKWNFVIPGLPESVEIHMRRLGQTGEQVKIARSLSARSRLISVGEHTFRVPSASDRVMISTLQRMYRHFYFRLCDIVDSASLADSGGLDFTDLRAAATEAGIWEGTATYLAIVSDYVKNYRGWGLNLPWFVRDTAKFGGDQIFFNKDFLRVPIIPQSAKLYGRQLAGLVRRREIHSGARLSLLPWLATAAVVGQKITGSDKGIW
jgi:hypothetical protein